MLAASGGFTVGSFTIASVTPRDAWWRIAVALCAVGLVLTTSQLWVAVVIVILLVGGASYEIKSAGTRCLVAAIFGFLAFEVGLAKSPGSFVVLAYGVGVIAGMAATWLSGLTAILPRVPVSGVYAGFNFLFLTLGLTSSIALTILLEEPRAYWIAFVFAMRGFVPLERQVTAIWQYGVWSGLGVCLAVLLQVAGLPMQLELVIAFGLVICGLKYVAHPVPISACAFTGAIVLGSTTTMQDAAYRAEAITIVVILVLLLSFALEWLWAKSQKKAGTRT